MERGIVKHTGINARNNRYGFIRSEAGDDVYFNQFGSSFEVVNDGGKLRLATNWHEGLGGLTGSSPFPEVGQMVLFERHRKTTPGLGPKAWCWCEETHFALFTDAPTVEETLERWAKKPNERV